MSVFYDDNKEPFEIYLKSIVEKCRMETYYIECSLRLLKDYFHKLSLDKPPGRMSTITVSAIWIIDKYINDEHVEIDELCRVTGVDTRELLKIETDMFNRCNEMSNYVPSDLTAPESNNDDFWKDI